MKASLGLLATIAVLILSPATSSVRAGEEVRVTIIVILATDLNKNVDRALEGIAKEIQKTEPTLTGFHMEGDPRVKSLKVGETATFYLVDDEDAKVKVRHGANEVNRVGLTLKAPKQGLVNYTTCCGKYFPIMTRYVTRENEHLIIAVCVQPCKEQIAKP